MKLHNMTSKELDDYRQYCIQVGNTSALAEINDFEKYYGNVVEVTGGRKIQKGTKGFQNSMFLRKYAYFLILSPIIPRFQCYISR